MNEHKENCLLKNIPIELSSCTCGINTRTTKDYLDEYAGVMYVGYMETVKDQEKRKQEIIKELEASIRKEVVEQYIREGYCEGMLDARDTGGSAIKVGEVRSGKQTPVSLRIKVEELSKGITLK